MVLAITIPCLCNVDLAVSGPREGFLREQPECRPDALRARRLDNCDETAAVAGERLSTDEPRRRVALFGCGGLALCDGAEDQDVFLRAGIALAMICV